MVTGDVMWQVCLFQPETLFRIKERQILSKMHFKAQGSSAVDKLHNLTGDDDGNFIGNGNL